MCAFVGSCVTRVRRTGPTRGDGAACGSNPTLRTYGTASGDYETFASHHHDATHHYPRNRITRATYEGESGQIETLESRLGGPGPVDVLSSDRRGKFAPDIIGMVSVAVKG